MAKPIEWRTPQALSIETGISVDRLKHLRYERKVFPFYKIETVKGPVYDKAEVDEIIKAGRVEVQ